MIGLKWKPDKSLVISVYREYLRFLIHFNSQEISVCRLNTEKIAYVDLSIPRPLDMYLKKMNKSFIPFSEDQTHDFWIRLNMY